MKKISLKKYRQIHRWLREKYGLANKCESPICNNNSKAYEWALLKGKNYKRDRKNYFMLCRACHVEYDFTPEKGDKISVRLKGIKRSKETRKKMSLAQTGLKKICTLTKEQRILRGQKISKALQKHKYIFRLRMLGNKRGFKKGQSSWNKGIPCKKETRIKISISKKRSNICV